MIQNIFIIYILFLRKRGMRLLNKEEEIFRLAAVLYKDGNYEVSKENTLKKIVKAIFLENDNIPKTISEIISAIFENYTLNFSENEIEVVIEKGSKIFQITKPQPVKYNLTEKNYIKLKNKIERNDLNFYIIFSQKIWKIIIFSCI